MAKAWNEIKKPVVRQDFTAVPGAANLITPLAAYPGCAVLVPAATPPPPPAYGCFYQLVAYIGRAVGPTAVMLPNVQNILLVDLPDGFATPFEVIGKAIDGQVAPPPPTGVGND